MLLNFLSDCMGPMKNLRQLYLEAQGTQCPNSGIDLPFDLLMEILSRVPAKSIARFSCVSRLWGYILSLACFTELFLTKSSCRRPPLLLFTFQNKESIFFFSAPQPQSPGDGSSLVPARYHVHRKHYPKDFSTRVGSPLGGFICRQDKGEVDTIVVSNPVTGESIFLPEVKSKHINIQTIPFLGYDPINKQFKVLCIKFEDIPNTSDDHQVLTLGGNKKHLWRTTLCKPHYPKSNGICIDGVLYYSAGFDWGTRVSMIVCFDVRSEKFSFINIDRSMLMTCACTLINYKGKLGALQFTLSYPRCLVFWALEDAGKCKWSKCVYTIPPLWNNIVGRSDLDIVGVTSGGEVVLAARHLLHPFYIYYYNPKGNTFVRVLIRGLEGFVRARVYTSLEYIENLKHMTEYDKEVSTNIYS